MGEVEASACPDSRHARSVQELFDRVTKDYPVALKVVAAQSAWQDPLALLTAGGRACLWESEQPSSHVGMAGAPCWVWNALAERAYHDGADYFYQVEPPAHVSGEPDAFQLTRRRARQSNPQVNDDTEFVTPGGRERKSAIPAASA